MFKSVSDKQLGALILRELTNIEINSVAFDSRSHDTEYAKIFYTYKGIKVDSPLVEIIDDKQLSICVGSMAYEFIGNDNITAFIIFTAVVIEAQGFIYKNYAGSEIEGFLTLKDVSKKCEDQEYLFDKSTAPHEPWNLYTMHAEFVKSYASLAVVDTKIENEKNDIYEDIYEEDIDIYEY